MSVEVLVVRTGIANVASMLAGLARAGARPRLTVDPRAIADADRVVLPGVGAFAAAMETLAATGLAPVIAERVRLERPTLAVCLGLQLLGDASEESPGVAGLRVFRASASRFPDGVRVPQLGWNSIEPEPLCRLLRPGFAYFANSYRLTAIPAGWRAATAEHGGRFVAAIERGPLLACQFHPELSGAFGLDLLRRWIFHEDAPSC